MKYEVFAVHDQKAEAFMMPFFQPNENLAIRGFSDACQNEKTPFGQHPQDYTLFKIGEYSDLKGEITPITLKVIGNGVEYLTPDQNNQT